MPAARALNDVCTYLVCLRGQVDEAEINELGPLAVKVERVAQAASELTAWGDQAGLIGLLRHLHGLGFVVLSVSRVERM